MGVRLKQLADQVIVLTGASSGIGLTTLTGLVAAGAGLGVAALLAQASRRS